MKITFKYSLLFLVLGFLLTTCNKKKEGDCVHDEAALYITVIDNNGTLISNAVIAVFDNQQSFEDAKASSNDTSFAKFHTLSTSPGETELLVDPYVEQWMLVTYFDSVQQKFLSSATTLSKVDPLQSCSDYHITVNLEVVGAVVTFWTTNNQGATITVEFNQVSGTLSGTNPIAPTGPSNPGPPNSLSFPTAAGTFQYQATSSNGCSWQGEVTVTDGQFITIELAPCPRALVAFYYNTASLIPTDRKTLTVFVDDIAVGTVNTEHAGVLSSSCDTPPATNVLYVYVEPGVAHLYKVQSGPGGTGTPCTWTGTIPNTISTNCATNAPIYIGQGCLP